LLIEEPVLLIRVSLRIFGLHSAAVGENRSVEGLQLLVQQLLGLGHCRQPADGKLIVEYIKQNRGEPV
jgi:hypothetical protein